MRAASRLRLVSTPGRIFRFSLFVLAAAGIT
jgi:hypothetical protein